MKTSTPITPEQQAQFDQEFSELYGYAWTIARRRLTSDMPPDDDLVSEAIAFSWRGYARIRLRKPDVPQKLAVRWAVRRAVSAVRGGAKFARTTPRNRDVYGKSRADMPVDVVARPYNGDPDDRRPVDARIALLPEHLRSTAEYLSYGLPKTTVAALLRTSTRVVYERVAEIAKLFAAVEPAAVETAPEPSDDEAPLPRGLRSYQPRLIPISVEHEHVVRPLHTRWRLRGWKSWKKSTGMEAGVRYVHPGEIRAATLWSPTRSTTPTVRHLG